MLFCADGRDKPGCFIKICAGQLLRWNLLLKNILELMRETKKGIIGLLDQFWSRRFGLISGTWNLKICNHPGAIPENGDTAAIKFNPSCCMPIRNQMCQPLFKKYGFTIN
jgi:hypothetical protein